LGAFTLQDPRVSQRAVQALSGQHVHQRAVRDLEIFNEIEAVDFGVARDHRGQIPALWRCRSANAAHAVLQSESREHAVDRGLAWGAFHFRLQHGTNRSGPRFTENAVAQLGAQLGDTLFDGRRRTVPSAARFAVTQIGPIKLLAMCSRNPQIDSTLADPEFARRLPNAHTSTHSFHHRAAARFQRRFLATVIAQ